MSTEIKKYVLGFAFNNEKDVVVLIEKQKPDWQKGKHNGVGGKIEAGETPLDAMVREFKEETGVQVDKRREWHHFATMKFKEDIMGGSAEVYCFRLFSDVIYNCETMESEKIRKFSMPGNDDVFAPLAEQIVIKNLRVLIPMAVDPDFDYCELNIK